MDESDYFLEWLVKGRMAEARAEAARWRLVHSASPPRPGLLRRLGNALLQLTHDLRRRRKKDARSAGRLASL
ncbi:MAG: hypothetical protein ACRDGM_13255 [bacterium]